MAQRTPLMSGHARRMSTLVPRRMPRASGRARRMSTLVAAYSQHGEPADVLRLVRRPRLEAPAGTHVVVRMLRAPVNPSDVNMIQGVYPRLPALPAVGGGEGVGEVLRVGGAVRSLREGDRVISASQTLGTWRTHLACDERDLLRIPPVVGLAEAATLAVNACTAVRLLEDFGPLAAGDTVIQNGANGGCGRAVIQVAAARGIRTVNVVRERVGFEALAAELRELGADAVVSDHVLGTPELDAALAEQRLPAPRLGLNCVGGRNGALLAQALGPGGTMVTYGGMSGKPLMVATAAMLFSDVTLRGFWLSRWIEQHGADERSAMIDGLLPLLAEGSLRCSGTREVALSELGADAGLAQLIDGGVKLMLNLEQ